MRSLTEDCIAYMISFTSPRDACRLSAVSKIFNSAAASDLVWERFLPPDYQSIISNSKLSSSSSSASSSTKKKDLFFSICENPILIEDGKKSFSLDKLSGKKCYMMSARGLNIVWGDTPEYWQWTSIPESRFPEVAELVNVCWLEICGRIGTHSLSPRTHYAAYLVYKLTSTAYGFEEHTVEVSVVLVGSEGHKRNVYLDTEEYQLPSHDRLYYPKKRGDDWMEIELGDFFNERDGEGELEMSVLETAGGDWKSGLIVQGMEIRPKHG